MNLKLLMNLINKLKIIPYYFLLAIINRKELLKVL